MFLHVTSVCHIQDYQLRIAFSDGVTKDVDLSRELHGEVFVPLRDINLFRLAQVDDETRTVQWPNGADFAPEFLYEIGHEVKHVA